MFRRRTPRHDAITDESIAPADDEVEGHVERTSSTLRSTLRSCLQVLGYRASDKSPIENTHVKAYSGVTGNRDFWDDVHGDQIWDGRRIELLRCSLTEWVALQPGLYHVEGSAELRGRALAHAAYGPQLGHHFAPLGKRSMLEAGVGCSRVGAVRRGDKSQYILGASFTQSCDQGMALILNESDYESVAEKIRDLGTVCISLSGRVHLLPAAMVTHRESETPTYYISVESIDIEKSLTNQPMLAAAYITFSVDESHRKHVREEEQWATSYCQFRPGIRNGNIIDAVQWLRDYARQYSNDNCRIIADFDAYHSYFGSVDLPLFERLRGRVSPEALQLYANQLRRPITIYGDLVEGDQFKDIEQSTIMNRSVYTFKPLDTHDPSQ
jgi:hypothetical protein